MSIVTFAPAVRTGSHVIVTAYGMSGCGKTLSLLLLGRGLVGPKGRLALLDTETGRGKIYAKRIPGGYDYAELTPPFTPERYIEAIEAAEEAGIEALIIDSGSHEWEGLGGVLEIADAGTSQSGKALDGLVKWAKPKARHKKYVQRLLNGRMHLLISLRAKERMVQLARGDAIPEGRRIGDIISSGYAPIQDKRFIFETTVQLFLPSGSDGVPVVEKCPEDLRAAFPAGKQISGATGAKIAEWVAGGEPVDHEFEAMKRAAEDAADHGTEALRQHWRALPKLARDRLAVHIDNLGSKAKSADDEAEERHRTFAPADAPEEPFGLPALGEPDETPAAADRKDHTTTVLADPTSPPRATSRATDGPPRVGPAVNRGQMADDKAGATPPTRRGDLLSELDRQMRDAYAEGNLPVAYANLDPDHRALVGPMSQYEGIVGGEG